MARGGEGGEDADVGAVVAEGRAEGTAAVRGPELREGHARVGGVESAGGGQVAEAQGGAAGEGMGVGEQDADGFLGDAVGVQRGHIDTLRAHGLGFSGHDEDGHVRIAELPGHPFFLATFFQPELAGDGSRPHPVVRAPARAAVVRAGQVERQPS